MPHANVRRAKRKMTKKKTVVVDTFFGNHCDAMPWFAVVDWQMQTHRLQSIFVVEDEINNMNAFGIH